jgi:GcrA cell cycle regulator
MWTEERVALLERLWGQGFSASQIASQLQGVSRNAVIGKIHRLGKRNGPAARSRPAFAAGPARRRPAAEARRPGSVEAFVRPRRPMLIEEEPGLATSITLTAHMCRWPIGDPDDASFSFCGQTAEGGRPYCQGHARIAYKGGTGTNADINRLLARYL